MNYTNSIFFAFKLDNLFFFNSITENTIETVFYQIPYSHLQGTFYFASNKLEEACLSSALSWYNSFCIMNLIYRKNCFCSKLSFTSKQAADWV